METNSLPIGVFDSGVGGLTVAREILLNLPEEKIIYFGDTARVPYGNKSKETIIRYSRQIVRFLMSQGVKAITVACNTASALALETIQGEFDIPIIGVVEPGAVAAVKATLNHKIGVIGTSGTVSSGLYERYIHQIDPKAQVYSKACPLFVHLVEEGMIDDPVTLIMIHRYLDELVHTHDIDSLILGCTHYPLLRDVIDNEINQSCRQDREFNQFISMKMAEYEAPDTNDGHYFIPSAVKLVNPAYETAMALKALLEEKGLAAPKGTQVSSHDHQYFVSDTPDSFRHFAENVLDIKVDNVQTKVLE